MGIVLTGDITEVALARFDQVCADLAADRLSLAAVMFSESGWYATAHNPNGHASGIFQAMPATLAGLGYQPQLAPEARAAAFRALSVADQMPWLRRYYAPYKGRLGSVTQCYLATFLPAELGKANQPDYSLAVKGGFRSAVYVANAAFDSNRDLRITVSELGLAVRRNAAGPRWAELVARLTAGAVQPVPPPNMRIDLGTIRGIQTALQTLGYDPGPADGVYGPKTVAAVKSYQAARGLAQDGVVGPLTRAVLAADTRCT